MLPLVHSFFVSCIKLFYSYSVSICFTHIFKGVFKETFRHKEGRHDSGWWREWQGRERMPIHALQTFKPACQAPQLTPIPYSLHMTNNWFAYVPLTINTLTYSYIPFIIISITIILTMTNTICYIMRHIQSSPQL